MVVIKVLHEILLTLLNVLAQCSVRLYVVLGHHAYKQVTPLLDS